jgi:hypothetical protein
MKRFNDFDPPKGQVILAYIRQGGFPSVAADAAGVPLPIFNSWLRRGEERRAREPLRSFARAVRQAIAQARLLSELAVCKKDPKFWLSHGPGRETFENAGWTTPVRPRVRQEVEVDRVEICRTLSSWFMQALTPFPEAREKMGELMLTNPPAIAAAQKTGSTGATHEQAAGLSSIFKSLHPSAN